MFVKLAFKGCLILMHLKATAAVYKVFSQQTGEQALGEVFLLLLEESSTQTF